MNLKLVSFGGLVVSFVFLNIGSLGVAPCSPSCVDSLVRGYSDVYLITAIIFVVTVVLPYAIYMRRRSAKNAPVSPTEGITSMFKALAYLVLIVLIFIMVMMVLRKS